MPSKWSRIAEEVLAIEQDLQERLRKASNSGKGPRVDDFEIVSFEQVWGSTALGFSGIGGQMMTSAQTYVLVPDSNFPEQRCLVYFAGIFAYEADYCKAFREDLMRQHMEPVIRCGKYREKSN